MILVDANLLIYAVDGDSPHHTQVRLWWENTLSGPENVGLHWLVLLAFVRVTTNPRIKQNPLQIDEALQIIERWLSVPGVCVVDAPPGMYPRLATELRNTGSGGNLTNDAFLAVLAVSLDATLCSADNDFLRFGDLKYFNPLANS